jgi:hypothetical protein
MTMLLRPTCARFGRIAVGIVRSGGPGNLLVNEGFESWRCARS